MAGVVDKEECLLLPFSVGNELHSITIHDGLYHFLVNILFGKNVKGPEAKLS